jgi:hypothetical protein
MLRRIVVLHQRCYRYIDADCAPTPDRHWGIILTDPAGLRMASVPSSQLNYRQLSSKLAIEDVISFMRSPHQPNGRNFKGFAVFAE